MTFENDLASLKFRFVPRVKSMDLELFGICPTTSEIPLTTDWRSQSRIELERKSNFEGKRYSKLPRSRTYCRLIMRLLLIIAAIQREKGNSQASIRIRSFADCLQLADPRRSFYVYPPLILRAFAYRIGSIAQRVSVVT